MDNLVLVVGEKVINTTTGIVGYIIDVDKFITNRARYVTIRTEHTGRLYRTLYKTWTRYKGGSCRDKSRGLSKEGSLWGSGQGNKGIFAEVMYQTGESNSI